MAISDRLSQALALAGIPAEVPCSYEKLQQQLIKINEQFQDDVQKTIDDLSYKTFGNFFITTAALLAEALGGAAVAIVDHYVGKALFENVLGAISGALSSILAAIPGVSIIIKYYAAVALREDLIRRQNLANILLRELSIIIHWVDVLSKAPVKYNREYYNNLKKSFYHVSRARRTINIEVTKYVKRSNYVSGANIQTAISDIDYGISYLTPGFKEANELLQKLHKDYKLYTRIPNISGSGTSAFTEYGDWFVYIKDFSSELKEKYKDDENGLREVIFKMVPALPDLLRKFAVNYVISNSSKVLVDRLPIWLLKNKTIDTYITKRFSNTDLPDFLGVTDENRQYAMFSNADTKDITWQQVMSECKLEEAAFMLVPVYMDVIVKHSGLIQTMIKPADNYLASVYEDMKGTIAVKSKDPGEQQMILNKKFGSWILKLEQAKTLLRTASSETGLYLKGYGGTVNLNTAETLDAMAKVDVAMSVLEDFIKNKALSDTESGDRVITLANTYLLSLVGQSTIFTLNMLAPNVARTTLAGLRSIQTLLVDQKSKDLHEQRLSENFIDAVQLLPIFKVLKRQIDSLLNQLESGNGKVAKELVDQIRDGDLSGLASYLDIASFATGVTTCAVKAYIEKGGTDENVMTRIQGALTTAGIEVAQQKEIATSITSLKKKFAMLQEFRSIVNEEGA